MAVIIQFFIAFSHAKLGILEIIAARKIAALKNEKKAKKNDNENEVENSPKPPDDSDPEEINWWNFDFPFGNESSSTIPTPKISVGKKDHNNNLPSSSDDGPDSPTFEKDKRELAEWENTHPNGPI